MVLCIGKAEEEVAIASVAFQDDSRTLDSNPYRHCGIAWWSQNSTTHKHVNATLDVLLVASSCNMTRPPWGRSRPGNSLSSARSLESSRLYADPQMYGGCELW